MKLKVGFLSALVAGALVLCASTPAKAIMMSVTVVNNSNTTGTGGGASSDRATSQSVTVGDAGGSTADSVGATIDAASRYISNAAADRGAALSGGTATAKINSDYTLTVSITAPYSGEQWSVKVDTRLTGGLTALDDAAGLSNGGSATVSNVTGYYNAGSQGGLGLTTSASQGGTSSTSGTQTNVNATNSYTVSGTGSGSFTLRFTWNTQAQSPQAANGGDEHASRFGASGPLGGASADDYPGPSGASRTQSNDGHFVGMTLTVNVVPEPSTFAMAGIGAVGLALAAWRRRCVR